MTADTNTIMIAPTKSLEAQIDAMIETDIDVYMEERENEQFKWGEPIQEEFWEEKNGL